MGNRFHKLEQGGHVQSQDQQDPHQVGCKFFDSVLDLLYQEVCGYGPVTCGFRSLPGDSNTPHRAKDKTYWTKYLPHILSHSS